MCHSTELVADLREEPVPTTSPTYTKGCPLVLSDSISVMGPTSPGSSGAMPGRGFLSIASACSGMSGRLHALGAGDKSSVLVSPSTLNTVSVMLAGMGARLVNHSASAQLCKTSCAYVLPASALSLTS